MKSQNLIKYVNGKCLAPLEFLDEAQTQESPAYDLWYREDQLALSWIKVTVTQPVMSQLVHVSTARDAWRILEKQYASQNNLRIIQLKR